MIREEILPALPVRIRGIVERAVKNWDNLQEIQLRRGRPVTLLIAGERVAPEPQDESMSEGESVSEREMREALEYVSRYSLYAFEEEIRKGFLTLPGGHRAGVAGKAVMEGGEVKTLRDISFLNLRVSREIPGCADSVMNRLRGEEGILSTLIVSPPGGGKTTILRDIVRQTASGGGGRRPQRVSVVDERSEIAGCCQGVPQKDLGLHCDVLDACEKKTGIFMMLRSMSPEVIAVDEIGSLGDAQALTAARAGGCAILATAHGSGTGQLRENPFMREIIEAALFERVVLLGDRTRPGRIRAVYDGKGNVLEK